MPHHDSRSRVVSILALAGCAAGLSIWGLVEWLPQHLTDQRLILAITAFVGAFVTGVMGCMGPLRAGAALAAGLVVALPAAALLWSASFRFDSVEPFLQRGHSLVAFGLIVALALPFAIATFRADHDPANYTALFENAWGLVTRVVTALVFVGLFWGVVFLSDALLQLVEISWIERALNLSWVAYMLTGLAAGLALAVAHRLAGVIGPDVPIQLLRMLLPPATIVTMIFLTALALRGAGGLNQLFGSFSAASTMMAMGYGATLLIASAVERGSLREVQSMPMRGAVGLLALMLPGLGGLSVLALNARVAQYGWTPDRLAAAMAAAVLCGYGATYAVSVLARGPWMQRIRRANVLMAAIILLAAMAWLNPVIGPQQVAARSLEARLRADAAKITDSDLALLAFEYGCAGQAVLDRVAAEASDSLKQRIALARTSRAPADLALSTETLQAALAAQLPVWPAGAAFPETQLADLPDHDLRDLYAGCSINTPAGAPGCVAVIADLLPDRAGPEALVFYLTTPDRLSVRVLPGADGRTLRLAAHGDSWPSDPAEIDHILAGGARLTPLPATALNLGKSSVFLIP